MLLAHINLYLIYPARLVWFVLGCVRYNRSNSGLSQSTFGCVFVFSAGIFANLPFFFRWDFTLWMLFSWFGSVTFVFLVRKSWRLRDANRRP